MCPHLARISDTRKPKARSFARPFVSGQAFGLILRNLFQPGRRLFRRLDLFFDDLFDDHFDIRVELCFTEGFFN